MPAAHIHSGATYLRPNSLCFGTAKKGRTRFGENARMFKPPAYDLFAITVMGFGVLLAGIILAFAF